MTTEDHELGLRNLGAMNAHAQHEFYGTETVLHLNTNELSLVVWHYHDNFEAREDHAYVTWSDGPRSATEPHNSIDEALLSIATTILERFGGPTEIEWPIAIELDVVNPECIYEQAGEFHLKCDPTSNGKPVFYPGHPVYRFVGQRHSVREFLIEIYGVDADDVDQFIAEHGRELR